MRMHLDHVAHCWHVASSQINIPVLHSVRVQQPSSEHCHPGGHEHTGLGVFLPGFPLLVFL